MPKEVVGTVAQQGYSDEVSVVEVQEVPQLVSIMVVITTRY